jgi:hypothetical protein
MEADDQIVPVRITHNSEQISDGHGLEQSYNYLVYEFETERHRYRARAYLHEIRTNCGKRRKPDPPNVPSCACAT